MVLQRLQVGDLNGQKGFVLTKEHEIEEFYAYGFSQYESGNWKSAVEAFRILCTRRPFEPRFWFGLSASLQEASSYTDALHAWAMTAILKEKDPYPHFHAAECYFSMGNIGDAAKALREVEVRICLSHPLREKVDLLKERWNL